MQKQNVYAGTSASLDGGRQCTTPAGAVRMPALLSRLFGKHDDAGHYQKVEERDEPPSVEHFWAFDRTQCVSLAVYFHRT